MRLLVVTTILILTIGCAKARRNFYLPPNCMDKLQLVGEGKELDAERAYYKGVIVTHHCISLKKDPPEKIRIRVETK